ncbi:DinB family protein [Mycobacterium sp. NPDC003323]
MTILSEQFDLVWGLAELHLSALAEEDFLWEPSANVWTVHRGADGIWRPDFTTAELDPIPVPTIAWLSWHIDWWWSATLAALAGDHVPAHTEVHWPGSGAAAVQRIRELADVWRTVLSDADLAQPVPYPWDQPKSLAHTASWLNVELMKNVAEIGQLRLLRALC